LFLVVDVAGNGGGHLRAARFVDIGCNLFAGIGFSAGNHHLGPVFGQPVHDGFPDALGRTRDERHFSAQIEE
jgi:hypothetical protein